MSSSIFSRQSSILERKTGGSDFHGLYNSVPTHLGSETTSKENLDRILKLAAKMK